jgi:hypothetical protein
MENLYPQFGTAPRMCFEELRGSVVTTPAITINFISNFEGQYLQGFPLLESKGYKATQFPQPMYLEHRLNPGPPPEPPALYGSSGWDEPRMTPEMLKEMYDAGHLVGLASKSRFDDDHYNPLEVSNQTFYDNVSEPVSEYRSWGISPSPFFYANTSNEYQMHLVEMMGYRGFFNGSISQTQGQISSVSVPFRCGTAFHLPLFFCQYTDTLEDITDVIDEAKETGTTLHMAFADIDDNATHYYIEESKFSDVLDYIESSGVAVMTVPDWYDWAYESPYTGGSSILFGSGLFDIYENKVLDHITGVTQLTSETHLHLALSTTTPQEDGTGITEPIGKNYSRIQINNDSTLWNIASNGTTDNKLVIVFPQASGAWGTITHLVAFAGDNTTLMWYGKLKVPQIITTSSTLSFAIGGLDFTID